METRNDIYTGLLASTLIATLAGCLFLFLDWASYPRERPQALNIPAVPAGYR